MVAIKNHEADRFLDRDVARYTAFLVFGPDSGLVSERVRRLVKDLVDDPADPFQLVRLAADELSGDPARLADETGTVPLFGGRRAVWLDGDATKRVETAVEIALSGTDGCPFVVQAGALKKDSALRKAFERGRTAAAIECYPDDEKSLARLVETEIAAAGLAIGTEARDLLVSLLGADRLASRSEIDKLVLYARGAGTVTADHVLQAVADASVQAADDAVDAAFLGDLGALDAALAKLHLGSVDAGLLVGSAFRHAVVLHRAKLQGPGGDGPFRYGMSPKRKAAAERQLAASSAEALARAVMRLGETVGLVRRDPRLAVDHATRALWSVAQAARPRGRR